MLCYLHFQIWTPARQIQREKRRQESIQHFQHYDSVLLFVNNAFNLMDLQETASYVILTVWVPACSFLHAFDFTRVTAAFSVTAEIIFDPLYNKKPRRPVKARTVIALLSSRPSDRLQKTEK